MTKKRVLVVCPSAAATSTYVMTQLNDFFSQNKFPAVVKICATLEVESTVNSFSPDLIVTNTKLVPGSAQSVPTVSGTPLLTGIGADETKKKILELLKD